MCSLFGLIDYSNALPAFARKTIIRILSQECEVRGTDAAGIAYNTHGMLKIYKNPGRASKLKFTFPSDSKVIMGHTRMTTKGDQQLNQNNHPFYGNIGDRHFALAHNGVLYNDEQLRTELHLPETDIQTDSYIAVQLLEKYKKVDFESLGHMSEQVQGSFCFSVLTDENELYLVRGSNPLAIYDCGGYYIYASTSDILDSALKRLHIKMKKKIKISSGDILKITIDGTIERGNFNYRDHDYMGYGFLNSYDDYYDTGEWEIVIEYAEYFGFKREDIIMLYDMGYEARDVEELLYDPTMLQTVIEEYRNLMACEYER